MDRANEQLDERKLLEFAIEKSGERQKSRKKTKKLKLFVTKMLFDLIFYYLFELKMLSYRVAEQTDNVEFELWKPKKLRDDDDDGDDDDFLAIDRSIDCC